MITITIKNENPMAAGWTACHLGLKKDCLDHALSGIALESFHDGFKMHEETVNSEDSRDLCGHGGTHVAFLTQATNQDLVPFVRDQVTIHAVPASA